MPVNRRRTVIAKVTTRCGLGAEFIEAGREGEIVTTRRLSDDPERLALVKWRGRSGHSSHPMSELTLTN